MTFVWFDVIGDIILELGKILSQSQRIIGYWAMDCGLQKTIVPFDEEEWSLDALTLKHHELMNTGMQLLCKTQK